MRIDMKMEKMSQKALERKNNKPIMEKKRRARINDCLNQLKALILETDNERSRHSKLEKADILEMTVRYLQTLRAYHLHLTQLHQISGQASVSPPANNINNTNTNTNTINNNNINSSLNFNLNPNQAGSPPSAGAGAGAAASVAAAMAALTNSSGNNQQLLQLQNHFQTLAAANNQQQQQQQIGPHQLAHQLQLQLPLNHIQQNLNKHHHQQSVSPIHHHQLNHHHLHHHLHQSHQPAQISPTWRPW